jgi:hypothetical protein
MQPDSLFRQPVQGLSRPVVHRLGQGVARRHLQPGVRLGLNLLELLPDLGLGAPYIFFCVFLLIVTQACCAAVSAPPIV